MKKHIPNLLTLGNLLCGTIAVLFAIKGDYTTTALLVVTGIFFDFLDGFVARILKVQGDLGKQLDSLADMVTSGVVPGIIMLKMLEKIVTTNKLGSFDSNNYFVTILPYIGLLLTLGACYRLAKFNIDTRQTSSFIGIPTPAMCLFVIALPLIAKSNSHSFFTELISNQWFLITVTIVLTYLMNAELPLFSLKFKEYSFQKNIIKYSFLIASVILLVFFNIVAIPLIIVLYVILSILDNVTKLKKA